jgi:hypothetical protein
MLARDMLVSCGIFCGIAETRNGGYGAILALRRASQRLAFAGRSRHGGEFFPSKNDGLADLLDIFAKYWLNRLGTGARVAARNRQNSRIPPPG